MAYNATNPQSDQASFDGFHELAEESAAQAIAYAREPAVSVQSDPGYRTIPNSESGFESMPKRKPRVVMLGLRGIPNVQGGVEKHVEILCQELVELGWDPHIIGRHLYIEKEPYSWKGIRVIPLWAPRLVKLEAVIHTLLGVFLAARLRPDLLHIHAVGPALMVPLARLLGMKVVVTHHGFDYERQKWRAFARKILKLGERLGMRFANGRIAVSEEISRKMESEYGVPVRFVPNGVRVESGKNDDGILRQLDLMGTRYIVMTARIVPEKRQTDLIAAFRLLNDPSLKLVLVGKPDHGSRYGQEVEAMAKDTPGVILAGFRHGQELACLFRKASLFVLPSSHEGMPIALLEALAYGIPVLASDIEANRALDLPPEDYYRCGDVEELAKAIRRKTTANPALLRSRAIKQRKRIEADYGWSGVSRRTLAVYEEVMQQSHSARTIAKTADDNERTARSS